MLKSLSKKFAMLLVLVMVFSLVLLPSDSGAATTDFQIGVHLPPPVGYVNSTQYDYLADAKVNLLFNYFKYWADQGNITAEINENIASLNLCATRDIAATCLDQRMTNWASKTDAEIDAMVDTYKDYSKTFGYFIMDEPLASTFGTLAHVYQRMLQRDPDCIPYVNMLPKCPNTGASYMDYLNGWISAVGASNLKYLSFDQYPFLLSGETPDYFENLEDQRSAALAANVKMGCYLQATAIPGYLRRPNANEMRYNAYTSLAYGEKALYWFTWWSQDASTSCIIDINGNKSDLFTPVKTINTEVRNLGPTLMNLTSQSVFFKGTLPAGTVSIPTGYFWNPTTSYNQIVSHFINKTNNRSYVMVVNRDFSNSRTLSFNLGSKPSAVTEISKTDGTEVSTNYSSSTGNISATFSPGEGKLYAISTDFVYNSHTGLDGIGSYSDTAGATTFAATKATATQNVTVNRLNLYVASGATGTAKMAIYSDNAGSPGTLLAQTGNVTLVNGWNSGSIPSINLTAGTNYWLVFDLSQAGSVLKYNTTGVFKYGSYAYGTLPSTAPTVGSASEVTYSFYADNGPTSINNVGLDTIGSTSDVGGANFFSSTKVTANQNITANLLNLYVASGATGTARMAIYTDNAGSPGTLLAQTGDITLVNGWNKGSIPNTNLTAGTNYWLVFDLSQAGSVLKYNATGTLKYSSYAYGALPTTAPAMTNTVAATYSFYASSSVGLSTIASTNDTAGAIIFAATNATATQNVTVNKLNLYVASSATGTARMGIYTDNSGSPGTLLAQTEDVTLVNGWNTSGIPSTNLSAGTNYWLVFNLSQAGSVLKYNATGTLKYSGYAYGALPSTAPAMSNTVTATYSFYASN